MNSSALRVSFQMLMSKGLIILVVAVALSAACKKQVSSPAMEREQSQTSANANTSRQVSNSQPLSNSQIPSFKPKNGYVPDEQTAIAIAIAVWSPIYGREQIESERPFKAILQNGVWTVRGTLPEGYNGGTAIAEIAQEDGRVLRVIHEQ